MNTKPCLLLALLTALPSIVTAQAKPSPSPSPGATPSFPTQVELVVVDAVVKDKKGTPVTDLKQADFTVLEDGQAQSIVSFEAVQLPDKPQASPPPKPRVSTNTSREAQTGRSFVIVFDDIHLTTFQARRAKIAVAEFLKTGVREGDRVTLLATGGAAWWSTRMEAGREELLALLKRLDGRQIPDRSPDRLTDYEAMRIHVYRDQDVEQRVSRRYDAYGVNVRSGRDSAQNPSMDGDPLVRGRAQEVYYQASSKNRITLGIVERVLQSLATTRGRKSMILVSEGFIFDPNLDEFKQVVQASRRANVAIYFLNTKGLDGASNFQGAEFGPALPEQDIGSTFGDALEAAAGAESIASDSGGFTVANTNDLGKGIQKIADDSRAYYLIGYAPQNVKADGRFRKIALRVNRKGLSVRARKGYFAPLEGGKAAEKKAPTGSDPAIQAALDSPFEEQDVPLRLTANVFAETLLGKAGVVVTTDVDVSRFGFVEEGGRFLDTIEFLLVVAHRETGEYFCYDQKVDMKLLPATKAKLEQSWFPISRDFELAPGGYQAKIVVRDKNNGRLGTVIHDFEVPDLSQLRTSSLVITDTLHPPEGGADGKPAAPRPAVVARRTFPSGAVLYAQFEVYGAAKDKATNLPKVTAGYVVRGSDGTALAEQPPTAIMPTSLGKLSRLVGFRLEGAAPGPYEMVLSVKDEVSGKALEVKEPFTVQ
ncbi:MAG TPA: VWA domain-containing protein [Vicinamibacteria bacterium]|nr:VWA domain-containing protein [Vicinamibacteria bacterium]